MKPPDLLPRDVEHCRHRRAPSGPDSPGAARATCGLLVELLAAGGPAEPSLVEVDRDACEACCRAAPPALASLNPVVASLVYTRAATLAARPGPGREAEADRLRLLGERARIALDLVYREPLELEALAAAAVGSLLELVPPPPRPDGPAVTRWAVGVTTAPRIRPVLEPCLDSLVRAGWPRPHLFIDAAVPIPPRYAHLPCTFREEKVGAFANYLLALGELLLRDPRAEAYLVAQDDALFYDGECLPRYLEHVLWPGETPGLVSLYCNRSDAADRPGWHAPARMPGSGPVALVFPRELAKAFVTDRKVFEHRWEPDEVAATSLGDLIPLWAREHALPIWLPTPSLVQHIGDTSTLWPGARAAGRRRASWFVGTGGAPAAAP
jgi:hypothetical protein